MPEFIRKMIVGLKRSPKMIPLIMMVITLLYFSLNLTLVSHTTSDIQGAGMGLSEFGIMLCSLLSLVCMLNAFPRRKKPVIPMIVLLYVMMALIIFCSHTYTAAVARSAIEITAKNAYINQAVAMLKVHRVLEAISAALVAALPIYSKLIRRIKTSVEVGDNGSMDQIEINE